MSRIEILKWIAAVILVLSAFLTSINYYPINVILGLTGGMMWCYAAFKLRDWALFTVNFVMAAVTILGLILKWSL